MSSSGQRLRAATPIGPTTLDRAGLVRRGRRLSYATLAVVSTEASVALAAGVAAGSVALLGYGADSVIELVSGAAALWRLTADREHARRARVERHSARIIGAGLIALAAYVLADAAHALMRREVPHTSLAGIAVALFSLVTMPALARAKRRVATQLRSGALVSDAAQASLCAYLSAILLVGLLLNAAVGWWWADPVAAFVMVPIIAHEGVRALRGAACGDACCE
jgi:divalent metal cation (Fe/Co/Zn/Cd) transporter